MSLKAAFARDGLFRKLVFVLLISMGILCIGIFLWYVGLWLVYRPADINALFAIAGSGNVNILKSLTLVQSLGLFIAPSLALAYFWSISPVSYLRLNTPFSAKTALWSVVAMLVFIPFINLITAWNQGMVLPSFLKEVEAWMRSSEENAAALIESFMKVNTWGGWTFNVFLIALLPAVGEELFFRGILQRAFTEKWGYIWAVWITAIIFSAIHLQFYGFVPRLLLGAFLGYLFVWTDSLWVSILAHFTNNSIALLFYFLKNKGYTGFDIDTLGTGKTWWIGFLSLLLFLGVVYIIRYAKKRKHPIPE